MWSENGPCAGPLHILLAEKEGRIWFNIICLKLYQFERICLSDYHGICPGIYFGICLEICLVEKIYHKNHGLPKFATNPPLGGRPNGNSKTPWNRIHNPPWRTPCRLSIHEVFFGPLVLHLREWSELGRAPPFRPMRALRLQWTWAFSLVCEVALNEWRGEPTAS